VGTQENSLPWNTLTISQKHKVISMKIKGYKNYLKIKTNMPNNINIKCKILRR